MTVATRMPRAMFQSLQTDARTYAEEWRGETPIRIHDRAIGRGGAPRWHADFREYIYARTVSADREPDPRVRTTRAFRLLRRKAVREFEVVYRIVVLGGGVISPTTLQATADWLNQRCERNNLPDRYTADDVLIMVHSGLDKVKKWW